MQTDKAVITVLVVKCEHIRPEDPLDFSTDLDPPSEYMDTDQTIKNLYNLSYDKG